VPDARSADCLIVFSIFGTFFGVLLKNGWSEQLKTIHTPNGATGVLREFGTTKCGEKQRGTISR
jgi:hypothetical protein